VSSDFNIVSGMEEDRLRQKVLLERPHALMGEGLLECCKHSKQIRPLLVIRMSVGVSLERPRVRYIFVGPCRMSW